MELTAKMLEEIKAAAQKALETSPQSRATSTVILALVTELERRDTEIAALRAAVTSYRKVLREIRKEAVSINSIGVVELMHYDAETIIALADGALQMMGEPKPDAAPVENALKVGDRVRIVKKRGILEGRLGEVVELDGDKHVVKFPSGKSSFTCDFTRDEIEPA